MAPRPASVARHPQRAAGPARRLHQHLQHPAAAPVPAAPGHPRHRLRCPAQGRPRRPHRRHPRPAPRRPRRRRRQAHPARRRQAPPHRHRPDPRPDPRPDARLRPARPRHQRRHRRTAPRAHHRPRQKLPAHRQATRTPARNTTPAPPTQKPRTLIRVRGVLDVPRHHTTPATTVPATTCKNSLLISPCSGEGLVLCWPVASGGNRPATVGLGEYVAKSHTMAFGWPPSPRKAWCIGFPLIWCPEPPIQRRSTLLCRDLSVSASGAGLSMSALAAGWVLARGARPTFGAQASG